MPITTKKLKKLIDNHKATKVIHYNKYERYYQGNNTAIQDKDAQPEPDNRKAMSYARQVVNTTTGYGFKAGNIVFTYPTPNTTIDYLNSEEYQLKETNSATVALSKGLSYKLVWQEKGKAEDDLGTTKVAVVEPENVIILWDNKIEPEKEGAIYFTDAEEIDDEGEIVKINTAWYYTAEEITRCESRDNGEYVQKESIPNPAKMVNMAEHQINYEKRNIFYHIIDLIDLQDEVISTNMANEIQTIANAILATSKYIDGEIVDAHGETDQDKILKAQVKIIDGLSKSNGDFVEWIVKNVQDSFIFGIFDRLDKKIPQLAEIIDWSDDSLYSDLSGEAMKYRLIPVENKMAMIEGYYKQGLYEMIEIMNAFPATDKIDLEKLTIEFKRNLPMDKTSRINEAVQISSVFGAEVAAKYLGGDILPEVEELLKKLKTQEAEDRVNEAIDLGNLGDTSEPQIIDEGQEIVKEVVLNGAQITAALSIIEKAVEGVITRETAVNQIMIFFNIDREKAELIVGQLAKGKIPEKVAIDK